VPEKPFTHQESKKTENPPLSQALKPKENYQQKNIKEKERCKNLKKEQSILLLQGNPVLVSQLVVQSACLFSTTSNFLTFHSIWFSTTLSLIQVFFFGFLFSFNVIHVCKLLFWVSACFFVVAASLPRVCFLCFHFLLLCVDRSESLRKHTSFL